MALTPEEIEEALSKLSTTVSEILVKLDGMAPKAEDEETEEEKAAKAKAEDEEKAAKAKAEDEETEEEKAAKAKAEDEEKSGAEGMDSLKANNKKLQDSVKDLTSTVDSLKKDGFKTVMVEVSKRDTLAQSLSHHVGTFDHAEMTLVEVARYGVEKLELKCDKGSEIATLNGYLHGRNPLTPTVDSKTAGESMVGLDDYIDGK